MVPGGQIPRLDFTARDISMITVELASAITTRDLLIKQGILPINKMNQKYRRIQYINKSNKVKIYPREFSTIVPANLDDISNLSKEYGITIARALHIKKGKEPLTIIQRGDASYIDPYT